MSGAAPTATYSSAGKTIMSIKNFIGGIKNGYVILRWKYQKQKKLPERRNGWMHSYADWHK